MNVKAKGYLLGAVAAATYGMNPLFTLPLYAEHMSPDSVLFYRYLLAIPILAAMLKARGRSFTLKVGHIPALAVLGLVMAMSSLMLFLSYNYMDAGIASTMLFVYPILVAVLMAIVYKERLPMITKVCMLVALIGIGLLYQGEDGATLSLKGCLFVFISAFSYAVYIIGVNHGSLKNIATLKVTFYVLLFGLLLYAVRLALTGGWQLPPTLFSWLNLLALAVFPTTISFLCTTQAIQYIGSTPTAILGALEPVTAIFFGVTVFNETLTFREVIGLVLIISAVTMVISGGNITSYMVRFRKLFPKMPLFKHKSH